MQEMRGFIPGAEIPARLLCDYWLCGYDTRRLARNALQSKDMIPSNTPET
jgi:hypothetical protein